MSVANEDQRTFWNSATAERWVANQDALDAMMERVSVAVLERAALSPAAHVVDVGCGAGTLTLSAARLVPHGRITGIDVSEALLARACERLAASGLTNVTLLEADAQTDAFTERPMDVAVSRFGVMFFDDPPAAFRNLRAHMAGGGAASFAAWAALEKNPWFAGPREAAIGRLGAPEPRDPRAPGPCAFAEAAYVREIMEGSGWRDVTVEETAIPLAFPGSVEELALFTTLIGPAAARLRECEGDDADRTAIAEAVQRAFAPFAREDGRVVLPSAVNLVTARA